MKKPYITPMTDLLQVKAEAYICAGSQTKAGYDIGSEGSKWGKTGPVNPVNPEPIGGPGVSGAKQQQSGSSAWDRWED
ncbi:MAG: cytochrome C [Prevotella sp.]|nr:cytochrome C [Prevotella sp.]